LDSQWGRTFRVLAIGGAPVPGEGLRGGRLGLPERLAEELSEELGRDVRVDALGDRTMTITEATASLDPAIVADCDVVLVRLGTDEALRLLRPSLWQRRLTALLDRVEALTTPAARVVVLGVPAVRAGVGVGRDDLGAARKHARRLNRISGRIARGRAKTAFLRLPRAERDLELAPAPEAYWRLARFLAPHIARRVRTRPISAVASTHALTRFSERVEALPTEEAERLLRLVSHVRMTFGTRYAALALTDDAGAWRHWTLGWNADIRSADVHAHIIAGGDVDVVTDARHESRFSALRDTVGHAVGFFAGAPVQWAGATVGALYVFDGAHRSGRLDEPLLRNIARMVDQELRSMLPEHPLPAERERGLVSGPPVHTGQFALTA
jgi:hypothetical protein